MKHTQPPPPPITPSKSQVNSIKMTDRASSYQTIDNPVTCGKWRDVEHRRISRTRQLFAFQKMSAVHVVCFCSVHSSHRVPDVCLESCVYISCVPWQSRAQMCMCTLTLQTPPPCLCSNDTRCNANTVLQAIPINIFQLVLCVLQ